jgi:nicotinate-nucleotide pyrophosphorylase (carboxylating)
VDSIAALDEAMHAGADLILLDNFTPDEMRKAVSTRDDFARTAGRRVLLEASGGLSLEVARAVGATGVDYVAVGELTHSAPVLDIGLDLRTII